jgi:purine-binding chemotaxis protein CheW
MLETLYAGHAGAGDAEDEAPVESRASLRSLVVFELSDELYGVPITDVAEIRAALAPMPLPHVPAHVLGVINLRGVVLPVIDLRRKFALPIKPEHFENRLVILKSAGYLVALWVDRVWGLARLPPAQFQPAPPGVARIDAEYYEQVATLAGRLLIELHVPKMLAATAARADSSARS